MDGDTAPAEPPGFYDALFRHKSLCGVLLNNDEVDEAIMDLEHHDQDLIPALELDVFTVHGWRDTDLSGDGSNDAAMGERMVSASPETVEVLRSLAWPYCHEPALRKVAAFMARHPGIFEDAPRSGLAFLQTMRVRYKADVTGYDLEQSRLLKAIRNERLKTVVPASVLAASAASAATDKDKDNGKSPATSKAERRTKNKGPATPTSMRERSAAAALSRFIQAHDEVD